MFKGVFKSGIRGIYNVSENPIFHYESWAIYPANHRQTGKFVSVFIFDKSNFESVVNRLCSQSPNTKSPKSIINECYEILRNEVSNLARLRHPQILTVIEPLEETKLKLLFATEPVTANLSTYDLKKADSVLLQKGLLEISKGVQFLHNMCSLVHLNLQPNSVFINDQGDWKLAGFKFVRLVQNPDDERFYVMNTSSLVPFANLDFNFVAPELVVGPNAGQISYANDIWSLGQLVFYIFNDGETLINCFDKNSISDFKSQLLRFEQKFYNHRPSELRYLLQKTPEKLWHTLTLLLAKQPTDRLSIDTLVDSEYFSGSLIKTMWFADDFSTKSSDEKLIFLEGLLEERGVFADLPLTFKNTKLLGLLVKCISSEINLISTKQFGEENDLIVSKALRVVLKIGSDLLKLSFQDRIYDVLLSDQKPKKNGKSPLLLLCGSSVRVRLALVSNTQILVNKLLEKQVSSIGKILAPLCLTFQKTNLNDEADQVNLQDLLLKALQYFVRLFDFPYIKNDLIPLLSQVFKTTSILSTKIQSIETFKVFIQSGMIDEKIITDNVLPIFENVRSRDKRIVSPVLDFYVDICQNKNLHFDMDIMVNSVLVQCVKLTFGCQDCDKLAFSGFLQQVDFIQKCLTDLKMSLLNSRSEPKKVDNFASLINSTLIKDGAKTDIEKSPMFSPISPSQDFLKPLNSREGFSASNSSSLVPSRSQNLAHKSSLKLKPLTKENKNEQNLPPGFSINLLTPQNITSFNAEPKTNSSDPLDLL